MAFGSLTLGGLVSFLKKGSNDYLVSKVTHYLGLHQLSLGPDCCLAAETIAAVHNEFSMLFAPCQIWQVWNE